MAREVQVGPCPPGEFTFSSLTLAPGPEGCSLITWCQTGTVYPFIPDVIWMKTTRYKGTSLVAQTKKNLPTMQGTRVWSLGWEDSLGKEMTTHSSILARRIPSTEEPSGLSPTGSQSWTRLSDVAAMTAHRKQRLCLGCQEAGPLHWHCPLASALCS